MRSFFQPCEPVRPSIGLLMFEFSRFWPTDYEHGREFFADLVSTIAAMLEQSA